jgi:Na+/proline symporter
MTIFIVLVIVMIVSAAICYYVAKNKNLNVRYWAFAGCLIGPFAIPFVFLANSKQENESDGV